MMKKIILSVTLFFIGTLSIYAQDSAQWKGLKLDDSSPQDAVNVLGKPKRDKVENVKFDKSIPDDIKNRTNFRGLHFENIDGFKKVTLLFLNEKLLGIYFTPKRKTILASDLSTMYEADFLFAEGLAKQIKYSDYEGQKETTLPKVYPPNYYMLSVKPESIVIARIENNSWKALWRDATKKPTVEMFPGYVNSLIIFSRILEEK